MRIEGIGLSDTGLKRARNEDHILTDNDLNFYVVCDGVGGGGNGDVASKMAAEACHKYVKNGEKFFNDFYKTGNIKILEDLLRNALNEACHDVYSAAHKNHKLTGMASTMTAVLFVNDRAILGHVGDSRLYLIRNNQVYVVTEDHTLGREARETHAMSEEEIKNNKLDHILNRSIGYFKSVEVDTLIFDILPGDELILCSDGFHNYLRSPVQIIPMIEHDEVNTCLSEMVQFAINGGGSDNISVILIRTKLEESLYMGFDSGKAELLNDFSIISKTQIFKDLNFIRLNRILNVCEMKDYYAGDTIATKEDRIEGIYIVYHGEVELYQENNCVGSLQKGDTFGRPALMIDYFARQSYIAKDDTTLLFISSLNFRRLCHNHPKFGVKLLENFIHSLTDSIY